MCAVPRMTLAYLQGSSITIVYRPNCHNNYELLVYWPNCRNNYELLVYWPNCRNNYELLVYWPNCRNMKSQQYELLGSFAATHSDTWT